MDLMKTVMVYMAMTFATSVYGAPAYQEATPPPAPTATAQVEVVALPAVEATPDIPTEIVPETEEPTAAPTEVPTEVPTEAPTATPTAVPTDAPTMAPTKQPEPTITPSADYKLLQKGSKGDEVKLLQERLIELGYLTGEADGVFGTRTKGAVERFQRKNDISRDGVAGKVTLTILFESETVIPADAKTTEKPTEAPTENPTQALVEVPIETPKEAPIEEPTVDAVNDTKTDAPSDQVIPMPRSGKTEITLQMGDAFAGAIYVNGNRVALESTPLLQTDDSRIMVDVKALIDALGTLKPDEENEQEKTLSGSLGEHTILICYTMNEQQLDMVELEVDDLFIDLTEEMIYYADEKLYLSAECLANAFGGEAQWLAEQLQLTLTI